MVGREAAIWFCNLEFHLYHLVVSELGKLSNLNSYLYQVEIKPISHSVESDNNNDGYYLLVCVLRV